MLRDSAPHCLELLVSLCVRSYTQGDVVERQERAVEQASILGLHLITLSRL
jgi:hypothetical protein